MLEKFRKFLLKNFINIPAKGKVAPSLEERIYLNNYYTVLGLYICLPAFFIFFALGYRVSAAIAFSYLVLYAIYNLLLRTEKHFLARVIYIICLSIYIFYICLLGGTKTNFSFFFVIIILTTFLIFTAKEIFRIIPLFVLIFLLAAIGSSGLITGFESSEFTKEYLYILNPFIVILCCVVTIGNALFYLRFIEAHTKRVKERHEKLELIIFERTKELNSQKDFLTNIIDAFPDPVYVKNESHEWILVNDAFAKSVNIPRENLVGMSLFDVYPNEIAKQYYEQDLSIFETAQFLETERRIKKNTGEYIYFKIKKRLYQNPKGEKFIVGVLEDITSFKNFEKEISEKNQILELAIEEKEQALKSKSHFFSTMTHELKTPLNAILGHTELMMQYNKDEGLTSIKRSANHLLLLIEDLLELSRKESGNIEVNSVEINPKILFRDLESLFSIFCKEKSLEFLFEVSNSVPPLIISDEKKIRQILTNLVGNAIKYTKSGFVKVTVKNETSENLNLLQIKISDSGVGITPEDQKKLFSPFFRTKEASSIPGTGLGLTLAKEWVELLGGTISLSSEKNIGSQFTINIPYRLPNQDSLNVFELDSILEFLHSLGEENFAFWKENIQNQDFEKLIEFLGEYSYKEDESRTILREKIRKKDISFFIALEKKL